MPGHQAVLFKETYQLAVDQPLHHLRQEGEIRDRPVAAADGCVQCVEVLLQAWCINSVTLRGWEATLLKRCVAQFTDVVLYGSRSSKNCFRMSVNSGSSSKVRQKGDFENYTLLCGRSIGRITRLARPSVRLSVCPSVHSVRARNSETQNVGKSKLV